MKYRKRSRSSSRNQHGSSAFHHSRRPAISRSSIKSSRRWRKYPFSIGNIFLLLHLVGPSISRTLDKNANLKKITSLIFHELSGAMRNLEFQKAFLFTSCDQNTLIIISFGKRV